jgi:hypothetical protein
MDAWVTPGHDDEGGRAMSSHVAAILAEQV